MVQVISEQEMKEVDQNSQYQAAFDNDRVAQILARSQRAVNGCHAAIANIEVTQERLLDLQEGLQQVNESMEKFDVAGQRLAQQALPYLQQEIQKSRGFGSAQSRF